MAQIQNQTCINRYRIRHCQCSRLIKVIAK
nr:MAG TPA: hypothetical protein [Caudoviricetes sp.]